MTAVRTEEGQVQPLPPGEDNLSRIPLDDSDNGDMDIESRAQTKNHSWGTSTAEKEEENVSTDYQDSYFYLGFTSSLFFSFLTALGVCLIGDLRRNPNYRRSCFYGFCWASLVHVLIALATILIIVFTQRILYVDPPTS